MGTNLKKRILITGGAGYIGSVIADLSLRNNFKVRVVDHLWFDKEVPLEYSHNPNYEFIREDLCREELLDGFLKDIDIIIHAAAVVGDPASKKFPVLTRLINYDMSIRLIEKIQKSEATGIIFLSTCSNYGVSQGMANEESPLKPLSLYAETKVGVERHLLDKVKNLDWVICRLSTVYGYSPRMRFDLTVNDFTMNAHTKKYLDIFLPYSQRPYIHVVDAAKIIIQMVKDFERVKNNVFNLGFNEENYQKIQIAQIVKTFMPETKIELVKSGYDLRDYKVDFSKLRRLLNIRKEFTVVDGVKEVLNLLKSGLINNPEDKKYYNTSPDLGEKECLLN
ncbi:MAG: SDR family oxidoreductase [Candidatus Omnitrophica bacterium]|nr:SDR family oxidoreductase [Candidatus Omnitrophota bacterium]MDD5591886.1 SDR family oxidoreductase [Candidatus Omnitrophota bacterium]